MGLFGRKKPKSEETPAKTTPNASTYLESQEEMRKILLAVLDDPQGSSYLFQKARERDAEGVLFWDNKMSETKDMEEVTFAITQLTDTLTRRWLLIMLEGLNNRLTQQREFMLRLLDLIGERSEQKIAALREEMKSRTLEPSQREVVDALLESFRKQQDKLGQEK